jgi:hypothetical protein
MSEWRKVEMSPSHDFEKEKELEGVLTAIQTDVGPNASTLYEFEKKNGENTAVWGSTVLDSRMKNVKIGEEVKIVYAGLAKESKKGQNKAKLYDVFHREPSVDEAEIDNLVEGIS